MKSFRVFLLTAALFSVLYLTGCSEDGDPAGPGDASIPANNVENINKSEVPTEPSGGDPRGTYYSNKPFFVLATAGFTDSTASNEANTMYKFEGSKADEGTYIYLEESVNVDMKIISFTNSTRQEFKISSRNSPIKEIKGTWKTVGDTLIMIRAGVENRLRYTADGNKGLYLFFRMFEFSSVTGINVYKKE